MTQERKRTYKRKQQADSIQSASMEMGNVPPHATDVEEAVLGAMMVSSDSVDQVMDLLKPETFYGHTGTINLAEIVRMMKELMESGTSVSAAIRGEQPKSGTAAALYAQQTENSATPLASLMMRFGVFVRNIAKLKLNNIQQFYTPDRYEEIAGQISQMVET